jgi:two-component system KDP operon response regulator KdpE
MNAIHLSELHTVLIVSKDTEMISVWETLFQQKNCYVVNETTPRTALQAAALIRPALIVLDLDLPQTARLDLCRKLRSTTTGTLLLLAPSSESENLFEYIDAGVNEHIPTPISPMALLVKSMAWLVRREWALAA